MCKINCSGGCIDCAPEEHAAGAAVHVLEAAGYIVDDEGYEVISAYIAMLMRVGQRIKPKE